MLTAALMAAAFAAAPAYAQDALSRAGDVSTVSRSAVSAGSPGQAKELSTLAFQGGQPTQNAVSADGRGIERSNLTLSNPSAGAKPASPDVPKPLNLASAGSVPLPGPGSFLARTAMGVAAGLATGLVAAWLFTKKHYAAGIGVAAGSIIGGMVAGPIGILLGGLIGGLLGHAGAGIYKKL